MKKKIAGLMVAGVAVFALSGCGGGDGGDGGGDGGGNGGGNGGGDGGGGDWKNIMVI